MCACFVILDVQNFTNQKKKEVYFELLPFELDLGRKPKKSSLEFALGQYRYCWMHGSTRILCNTLKFLCKTVTKNENLQLNTMFKSLIGLRKSKDATTNNLTCHEAKIFLEKIENLREFAKFFSHSQIITPNNFNGNELIIWNACETVYNILLACKTFMNFSYFPHPNENEFKALDAARQILIKLHFDNDWKMVILTLTLEFFVRSFTTYFSDCLSSHNVEPFDFFFETRSDCLLLHK